jgi:hypothetical protein
VALPYILRRTERQNAQDAKCAKDAKFAKDAKGAKGAKDAKGAKFAKGVKSPNLPLAHWFIGSLAH